MPGHDSVIIDNNGLGWDSTRQLSLALLLSLLLHLLAVLLIGSRALWIQIPEATVIKIALAPLAGRQIVSPPDIIDPRPPQDSAFLSDQDTFAEREQLRRGDGPEAGPVLGERGAPPAVPLPTVPPPTRAQREPQTALQRELPLDLSPQRDLLSRLAGDLQPEAGNLERQPEAGLPPVPQPFSRPLGSGARFLGREGSTDFLPHLQDGDLTLLNAKADKFAVFVRRVAIQVFNQIRIDGWQSIRAEDVLRIKDFVTVIATLDPSGRLLKAEIIDPSGSRVFDQSIQRAVKSSAFDHHPPPKAAGSDGNYRFIFRARTWVRMVGDGRSGISERRWLILQTGLE